MLITAGAAIGLFTIVGSAVFSVKPNERAFVTQFGRVLDAQRGPIGPGLHFKLPLVTSVGRLPVSIDVLDLGNTEAFTKDAQRITLHITVTTQVPDSAVYHLLYEVGGVGNVDLERNYRAVIADRVRTVVGRHEINEVAGAERQAIIDEVSAVLSRDLAELFGIKVDSVQSALVGMPPTYAQAIEAAMQARTQRQAAEQNQARARVEAETAKVRAAGEADATQIMAKALEINQNLVSLRIAEKWNGVLPQNMYGSAPLPLLSLPK